MKLVDEQSVFFIFYIFVIFEINQGKQSEMEFGKKQLEKYGWNQGQGLGKNQEGIKKAIGVSIKNDKDGLGTNQDEYSFQWWYFYIKTGTIYSTRLLLLYK